MYNPDSKTIIYLVGGSAILADKLKENLENEVLVLLENTSEDYFIEVFEKIQQYIGKKASVNMLVLYKNVDYHNYGFLSGLLKTANQENVKLTGKTIGVDSLDLDKIDFLTGVIEKEEQSLEKEIRYHGGTREVKIYQKVTPIKNSVSAIKEGGVYLITGGAGGIGLIFANYISKVKDTNIILTGRSPLDQTKKALISELQNTTYSQVDVNDEQAVESLINSILTEYKKINGIIHSAGLIKDSFIQNKKESEIREVLKPKLQGVKNLDEATKTKNLDFMVFFSSVAGVMGNIGQSDYASANAYLDNYAEYRNGLKDLGKRKGQAISINWSLWKDGGMQLNADSQKYIEKQFGLDLLPTDVGIKAFENLLKSGVSQGVVTFGKEKDIYAKMIQRTKKATSISSQEVIVVDQNDNNLSFLKHATADKVVEIASQLLKLDRKKIKREKELGDYGFGSILLTKFSNELSNYYDIDLIPTVFYNYPTINDLTDHLIDEYINEVSKRHVTTLSKRPEEVAKKVVISSSILSRRKSQIKQSNQVVDSPSHKDTDEVGYSNSPVAIIGISGRLPGSPTIENFWENIRDKRDLISEIPVERWDWKEYFGNPKENLNKTKAKWGGFIDDIDKFDSLFFSISPREAELMDPQQRITLETVYNALEDAGIASDRIKGTHTGVFIGASSHDYTGMINNRKDLSGQAQFSTGSAHSILANRISYLLDIHGPSEPIDTACSSSLIAIHRAVENIRSGLCSMAIAGGVNAILSPDITLSFSQAGMLSEDGRCKTFDQNANGYVRGEGVGIVILKRLEQAEADGDHIYGIIKGTSENHGGKANTLTSPNPLAQKDLLVQAYTRAKIDPRDVSYIEAHGTGTPLGDPIEIEGLKSAFSTLYEEKGLKKPATPHCAVGSVKTNIGHLEAAAGIAGVLKVVYALKHKTLPGNPNLKQPNEYLKLENTPFYLLKDTKAWETIQNKPRVAGISSFGFGGANAHVIIEEYKEKEASAFESNDSVVIVLSAKNKKGLRNQVVNLKRHVEQKVEDSLYDIAFTLQNGRNSMEERLAFVISSKIELIENLSDYLEGKVTALCEGNIKNENSSFILKGGAGEAYVNYAIENKELSSLVQLWATGIDIDWSLLYANGSPKKISLPTYPFARDRHWIPEIVEEAIPLTIKSAKTQQSNLSQKIKMSEIKVLNVDKIVLDVVSDVLRIERDKIADDVSFESLGLDSILIHSLLQGLKKHSFTILPNIIWEYNNIKELSRYILENPIVRNSINGNLNKETKGIVESSIIEIPLHVELLKRGTTEEPIFIIPGSPGISSSYSDLAEFINSRGTIYGLNWKGVMENEEPFETMDEIVEHNIKLIDKISINKPIQLIGHSYGALIVYEMLKHYEGKNREVRNIVLIDSSPKILNTKFREKEKMTLFLKSISYNQKVSEREVLSICTTILKQPKSKRLDYMLSILNDKEIVKSTHNSLIKRMYSTYYSALGIKYSGEKVQLPYKVNIIKAKKDTVIKDTSAEQSWNGYFSEIKVTSVQGDHFSVVKDRNHAKWIENIIWN